METYTIYTEHIDGHEQSWRVTGEPFAAPANDIPFDSALWVEGVPEYILGIVARDGSIRVHTTERIFEADASATVEVIQTAAVR